MTGKIERNATELRRQALELLLPVSRAQAKPWTKISVGSSVPTARKLMSPKSATIVNRSTLILLRKSRDIGRSVLPDLSLIFLQKRVGPCFTDSLVQLHLQPILHVCAIGLLALVLVDRLTALRPEIFDIVCTADVTVNEMTHFHSMDALTSELGGWTGIHAIKRRATLTT
jgi:hypothetical protein